MSFFTDRLRYLLSLKPTSRYKNNDWVELKTILKEAGLWKSRPRGKFNIAKRLSGKDKKKKGVIVMTVEQAKFQPTQKHAEPNWS